MISASGDFRNRKELFEHAIVLSDWFDRNGWAGMDPYDILGKFPFRQLQKNRYTRYLSHRINELFPGMLRALYGFHPAVNPKTVALLALAYQQLFAVTQEDKWAQKSRACLDWLKSHPSRGYSGPCWGYPFGWQSRSFIPAGTPTAVVTALCCQAFLRGAELFDIPEYGQVARQSASFFLHDLHIDRRPDGTHCFSYTPRDRLHVHNANLWVAAALDGISAAGRGAEDIAESALRAARYTFQAQGEDGSWDYFGPPDQAARRYVDVYHSGFNLRCLHEIFLHRRDPELLRAIERGYHFLTDRLLVDGCRPKFRLDREYPADIHACAEAIICSAALSTTIPRALETARKVAVWTIERMSDARGNYYYRRYPRRCVTTTYIRWGQAWMLLALSSLLAATQRPREEAAGRAGSKTRSKKDHQDNG